MKIAFDARYQVESGGSTYIRELIPEILRLGPEHEFVFVRNKSQRFAFEQWGETVVCPLNSAPAQAAWTLTILPRELFRRRVDVCHGMKFPSGPRGVVAAVHTVHSRTGKASKSFPVPLSMRLYLRLCADPLMLRNDRLIAVSSFVRDYLVERHGVPSGRIDVIPHGVAEIFHPVPERKRAEVLSALGVDGPYLLAVGNVFPVKNHVTAVRAFARLKDRFPGGLLIAGGLTHPYVAKVRREIGKLGLENRVRLMGFQPPALLAALLSGAEVVFMTSLTEGFALAMAEALACGAPVVASKVDALAELGEGVAELVPDPLSAEAFAEKAAAILADPLRREKMRSDGLAKARTLTWRKAAESHLKTYLRAVSEKKPGVFDHRGIVALNY